MAAYDNLRKYLNAIIAGPKTDAIIAAIGVGDDWLQANAEALVQNYFKKTASGINLDTLITGDGWTRPELIDLNDDVYRDSSIKVLNRQTLTSGFLTALDIFYSPFETRAYAETGNSETYVISNNDDLIFEIDGKSYNIQFNSLNFTTPTAATALEVADEITDLCANARIPAFALSFFDGNSSTTKVRLLTNTLGPRGFVRVWGGKAQDKLAFNNKLLTTQNGTTQFSITNTAGITSRFAWKGGTNPSLNLIQAGDYVTIYSGVFNSANNGSFTITKAVNSSKTDGSCYFEINNPTSFNQSVTLAVSSNINFYRPIKRTLISNPVYATSYEISNNQTDIYIPAITSAIDRTPTTGGAYLPDYLVSINHSNISNTFTAGETLLGQTSLATGYVITSGNTQTTISLVSGTFTTGEVLLGEESLINATLSSTVSYLDHPINGPYLFDLNAFEFFDSNVTINQNLTIGSSINILNVSSTADLPNSGYLVVDYGYDNVEQPIPYVKIINSGQILLDNTYIFKQNHVSGASINPLNGKNLYNPDNYEYSYGLYLTDIANARENCIKLLKTIKAAGTKLNVNVLYPSGIGYGDISFVYGVDET